MAIGFEKKTSTGRIPVFESNAETATGGFLMTTTGLAVGQVVPAGTPLVLDESARTAIPMHSGVMYANAASNAVAYQVKKGNTFAVGDYFASGATGGKAYAITAIDTTTSTLYDTITVGTTIGATTAGDVVYQSSATGATASALAAYNGLLYDEVTVTAKTSCSAVVRGTVYARRIPYNASIAALTGLKFILFSQSK